MLDCALISPDEAFRHAVLGLVRQTKNNARVVLDLQVFADHLDRAAVAKIRNAKPTFAFVDLGLDPSSADGIRVLAKEFPELTLVVAGPALDAKGVLAVMRSGASEFLPRPISTKELEDAFQRVRSKVRTHVSERARTVGRVMTVFSAKGGTGVTTVASNLAVAIRMLTEKSVLLVDLLPALGTAAIAMGVQPRYTHVDVIQNFHRLDEELLQSFLEVDESGVHVLASPDSDMATEGPTEEEILSLMDLVRHYFDFVVVDGGNTLSSRLEPLLQISDDRFLVGTPDLPALRNMKRAFDFDGRAGGKPPPTVFLNRYEEGVGLSSRDVEDGLGHGVDVVLRKDSSRMVESANVGRPEVLVGRSPFSKELLAFAEELVGTSKVKTPGRGLMGWIRRVGGDRDKSRQEAKK